MNISSITTKHPFSAYNILALAFVLLLYNENLSAALITYDEQYFLSHFTNPTGLLTFERLKDGTAYTDAAFPNPLLTNQAWGNDPWGKLEAREYAWSDDYLIRTTNGYGGYWTAMRWDGTSLGNQHHSTAAVALSIVSLTTIAPISLEVSSATYNGFIGIIPENSTDNHYLLNLPQFRLEEMAFGYQVAAVPAPSSASLFVFGLFGFLVFNRSRNHRKAEY